MKTAKNQILSYLSMFGDIDVLSAIKDWNLGRYEENKHQLEESLTHSGWEKRNFSEIIDEVGDTMIAAGSRWFLSKSKIVQQKDILAKEKLENPPMKNTDNSQGKISAELGISSIRCPKCQSKMYKQSICPACKEGRAGYKIRLICEENVDHEVLL